MTQRTLQLLLAACLSLAGGLASAQQTPLAADPPASAQLATPASPIQNPSPSPNANTSPNASAAPAMPAADENNAQRARSQPYNNAPFWRDVLNSGSEPGYTSLPGSENGVLIQEMTQYPFTRVTTAGEAWRVVRNRFILPYGGALLLIVVVAIGLFYKTRGPITVGAPDTGRKIERFTYFERAAHWSNAIAFVLLAVSGLVMAFGKFILLPLVGGTLFGWFAYALKNVHNFAGPVFAVSLVVVFFTFLRSNWPSRDDFVWLRKGGGLFNHEHVPSGRFNAGEKIIFWGGVFALGIVVVASGLVLDKLVPGMAYTRGDMQIANMVHGVSTVLMMAMFMGHIYLGTVGMTGAYQAMRTGYVDEAWAHEHHQLWADDIAAGKIPAQRSAPPEAARDTARA